MAGLGARELGLAALLTALPARAAYGPIPLSQDNAFGTGGVSATALPAAFEPRQMHVTSAGLIYSLSATPGGGAEAVYHVTRRLANGALDVNYGSGGTLNQDDSAVAGTQSYRGLCVGADGALFLVGATDGAQAFIVRKFLADASPDDTWGTDGLLTIPFAGEPLPVARGCAVQPDGKLIVVGSRSALDADERGLLNQAFAARLTTAGGLDQTFNGSGIRAFRPSVNEAVQFSFALVRAEMGGDGSIYAAGETIDPRFQSADLLVAKFTPSGLMGDQYGTAGSTFVPTGPSDDHVAAARLNAGDTFVVALLRDTVGSDFGLTAVSFNSRGFVDPSYGCAGFKSGEGQFPPLMVTDATFDAVGRALFLGHDPGAPEQERLVRTSGLPELADGGGDSTLVVNGCRPWRGERNIGGGGLPAAALMLLGLAAVARRLRHR